MVFCPIQNMRGLNWYLKALWFCILRLSDVIPRTGLCQWICAIHTSTFPLPPSTDVFQAFLSSNSMLQPCSNATAVLKMEVALSPLRASGYLHNCTTGSYLPPPCSKPFEKLPLPSILLTVNPVQSSLTGHTTHCSEAKFIENASNPLTPKWCKHYCIHQSNSGRLLYVIPAPVEGARITECDGSLLIC